MNNSTPYIRLSLKIALALFFVFLAVPGYARNYSLHSPKVWTQEEKELFDKGNDPPEKEQEGAKMDLEPVRLPVKKEKKRKVPAKKQKAQPGKDQIQVVNGVSYREVTVQKGETLYGISLKYRNEGASYSEVLRFNGIKTPDRVAVGDIVKIPLNSSKTTKQQAPAKQSKPPASPPLIPLQAKPAPLPVNEPSLKDVTTPDPPKSEQPSPEEPEKPQPAEKQDITPPAPPSLPPAPLPATTAAQKLETYSNISSPRNNLFEQAVKSYRMNDCQTAVQLFGRFLVENRDSKLAADVSVFIADCYLKLSGK